jgi:hypothetical protein
LEHSLSCDIEILLEVLETERRCHVANSQNNSNKSEFEESILEDMALNVKDC